MAKEITVRKSDNAIPWRPRMDLAKWESDVRKMMDEFFNDRARAWWPERWSLPTVLEIEPPVVDIYEEDHTLVVKAELPGVGKESIDVRLTDHVLIIEGEKNREEKFDEEKYYLAERGYGPFSKSIELPKDVEGDKVKAAFKNGVLEITLPVAKTAKAKTIKLEIEPGPIESVGQN